MVAPVHFKPPDENDLATPAREITSRHRVDRRSLLPPRRVMPQRGMPPAASAETPVAALGADRGCARQRAAVLDHGAAPAVDLSCVTSPTGCGTKGREERHRHFADGQDASQKNHISFTELFAELWDPIDPACQSPLIEEERQAWPAPAKPNFPNRWCGEQTIM